MSAHLLRFLLTFWGMLSLRAKTRWSLVAPGLISDSLFACLRHRRTSDAELGEMTPEARVGFLLEHYGDVLGMLAPDAIRDAEPMALDEALEGATLQGAFEDVRTRLPELRGDLSIDAVNAALGKDPNPGASAKRKDKAKPAAIRRLAHLKGTASKSATRDLLGNGHRRRH